MQATRQIAEQAIGYEFDELPEDVVSLASLAMLDNIGCAVRGANEELSKILCEELVGQTVTGSNLISGQAFAGAPNNHAMIYGASAHAIDFDDTLPPALAAHAGSAVIGALVASLPSVDASGQELICAIVAGYESAARVASLLHPDHYLNGFHPTATVGVFGAAAAVGRLMRFDRDQMQQAFGLAATQAAGLKCVFGTMTKPFNAGHAASAGLLSARLIARGFTAPTDALEASKGYTDMFIGKPQSEWSIAPKDTYAIRKNAFKFHAACHATHPMIEAIERIQDSHAFDLEDIESITVETSELGIKTASIVEPTTGLECKFSFYHVAAAALVGADMAADQTYSEAMLQDAKVTRLRKKVTLEIGEDDPFFTRLVIVLNSGETLEQDFNFYDLMKDQTRVRERLRAKFSVNTGSVLGTETTEAIDRKIMALHEQPSAREVLVA